MRTEPPIHRVYYGLQSIGICVISFAVIVCESACDPQCADQKMRSRNVEGLSKVGQLASVQNSSQCTVS